MEKKKKNKTNLLGNVVKQLSNVIKQLNYI